MAWWRAALSGLRARTVARAAKLGAAWVWLLAVCFGLKALGLRRLLALMPSPRTPNGRTPRARLQFARRQADLFLRAAGHLPFEATCLQRSVALCWWLRLRGVDATLRLGVLKAGDARIQAHAWVEVNGEVVGDRPEAVGLFVPLSRGTAR